LINERCEIPIRPLGIVRRSNVLLVSVVEIQTVISHTVERCGPVYQRFGPRPNS